MDLNQKTGFIKNNQAESAMLTLKPKQNKRNKVMYERSLQFFLDLHFVDSQNLLWDLIFQFYLSPPLSKEQESNTDSILN